MSKQSEDLRQQARRAARLAGTIGSPDDAKALKTLAQQFDEDAERIERSERPPSVL
ncbi:hypothetical protein JJE66_23390 [Bradyrhizobium diazoefficiens]|uniref:hypothetical protein n=1 Tax=Bradyrhizobium diazoefficiens TaxID=1355477 RepID=UPI00190E0B1F|nr:hypothetical protein [Bradyrhizobium diazoefficiens]MBK3664154.1 hypothetical protein [Bradyrhizobium diazoefficiens]